MKEKSNENIDLILQISYNIDGQGMANLGGSQNG
jgi:hypothetical protein